MHDLRRVVDVLDGVLCLTFFEDVSDGNTLRGSELGHGVGLDEVIVCGTAGHDDVRGDASLVFAHAFEDTFALFGRWSAIDLRGSAEHDDGVEVCGCGVVGGKGKVVAVDDEAEGKGEQKQKKEEAGQKSHAVRVAEA